MKVRADVNLGSSRHSSTTRNIVRNGVRADVRVATPSRHSSTSTASRSNRS